MIDAQLAISIQALTKAFGRPLALSHLAVLLASAAAGMAIAYFVFARRDL